MPLEPCTGLVIKQSAEIFRVIDGAFCDGGLIQAGTIFDVRDGVVSHYAWVSSTTSTSMACDLSSCRAHELTIAGCQKV
jgi:hypothetical protein